MMEEPLHPAPHQRMPHMYIADAEEGAKAQLCQKISILLTSSLQELTEVGPSTPTNALGRILHKVRKKSVNIRECEKYKAKKSVSTQIPRNDGPKMMDGQGGSLGEAYPPLEWRQDSAVECHPEGGI
jgi:hypothetical protein